MAGERIAPTVAGGKGTADLRWVEPADSLNGLPDLVDGSGRILGYVGNITTGVHGYVINHDGRYPRIRDTEDFSTEPEARAWVEAEARRGRGDREGER